MKRKLLVDKIKEEKIVAIVRLMRQLDVASVAEVIIDGGIRILEITSNTPGFLHEISNLRKHCPDVLIGAGTVTSVSIATDAIHAGAQFLVTPNTNVDVIARAHQYDIPVIMGALTPTEINLAVASGADMIKLFPAKTFGLEYFKAIKAVFHSVDFFAVGGIDLDNVHDWIRAGVSGIGVGGSLIKPVRHQEEMKALVKRTSQFVKCVKTIV